MTKNAPRAPWPRCGPRRLFRWVVLPAAILALAGVSAVGSPAATWQVGDVFTGVSSGDYKVWSNAGVFKEEINQGPTFGGSPTNAFGFTTGCAFNPSLTHLYTTNFTTSNVVRFQDPHPHTIDQTIVTPAQVSGTFTGAGDASLESIVFAANGDFYVGHADGTADIHKYNAAGVFIRDFNVATEARGSDWIELAADQATMFYTSEGRRILRYDVANDVQLPDFAVVPVLGFNTLFALRLLPPGDGSGGLLVADRADVKRLNAAGAVVQTYDAAGENTWFSLNLDPNGTSFWAGDAVTDNFYRFNIATGAVEVGPINTFANSSGDLEPDSLSGICVKGEPTAGGGGGGGGQCPPPTDGDDDGDGLKNSAETLLGLLSLDSDSDDDGTPDGDEDEDGDGEDNEDEDDDEDDECPDNEGDDDDDDDGVDNEDEDD